MSNPERLYDKTHLSIDTAEERVLVHRDYIAHCLRWSHVVKHLYKQHAYKTAKILDVGCGKEMPLAKLLYSNRMSGAAYVGVDMNKLEMPDMLAKASANDKIEVHMRPQTDASKLTPNDLPWVPNIVTCFECYEHMHPRLGRELLHTLRTLTAPGGHMFFSTPCWNGSAAANHVNEPKFEAMRQALLQAGWNIEAVYGTFASQTDYVHKLGPEGMKIFNGLAEYYDSNLLAVMLAPLVPQYSRNALWHCTARPSKESSDFSKVPEPWSQHKDYKEMLHD